MKDFNGYEWMDELMKNEARDESMDSRMKGWTDEHHKNCVTNNIRFVMSQLWTSAGNGYLGSMQPHDSKTAS